MNSRVKHPTIFITGVSGFIGRNLIEDLPKTYHLLASSHQDLDLLDEEAVEKYFSKHNIDVVIYCSNVGGTRKTDKLPNVAINNLRMFFNIVRTQKYKKMIFLGSGAEYDKRRSLKKIQERDFDKRVPSDEYGFYKYICSKFIQRSDNIVNLRLFGVFGKYENYNLRFISNALCRNILGLPIVINQNVVFDYLYINDLVKIIDFFIKKNSQEKFFNVGRGEEIDLLTIAKEINDIAENKSKIIVKKNGFQNEYTCENTLFLKTIKNFTFTDFKVSLRELYNYYKGIKTTLDIERI